MKVLALNIDFNCLSFYHLCSRSPLFGTSNFGTLFKMHYRTLYTDSRGGSTLDWCCHTCRELKFFVFSSSCRNGLIVIDRMTTCLENLEMSGNLKHIREMSGMLLTVREMSGKKSCHGKVTQNCSLLDEYLRSYGYLNISISFKNSA